MENPTLSKKGRASCVRFADGTHEAISLSVLRAQHLAARHAMTLETAAIFAALAFGGSQHG